VIQAAKHATTTIPIVMGNIRRRRRCGARQEPRAPWGERHRAVVSRHELSANGSSCSGGHAPALAVALLRHVTSTSRPCARESADDPWGCWLQVHEVQGPEDFDQAFRAMSQEGKRSVIVLASPSCLRIERLSSSWAAQHRLPAVYQWPGVCGGGRPDVLRASPR